MTTTKVISILFLLCNVEKEYLSITYGDHPTFKDFLNTAK